MSNSKSYRWAFDCNKWNPTKQDWLFLSSVVQTEEKDRIGRFYFQKDAKSVMAGRLLIRKFLTTATSVNWKNIEILRDDKGKPYYPSGGEINFNISHQGGIAVLAAEVGKYKIGIDVMKYEYRSEDKHAEFLRLMRKQLSESEWELVDNSKNDLVFSTRMFYRLWCLKESYLKAVGTGLTVSLKNMSFKINTFDLTPGIYITDTELYINDKKLENWSFHELLIDDATCTAVALSPNKDPQDGFKILTYDELIENAEQVSTPDEKFAASFSTKPISP